MNGKMTAESFTGMNQDGIATRTSTRKYMPEEYFEFKSRIHDRLLNLIDLSLIEPVDKFSIRRGWTEARKREMHERTKTVGGISLGDL